jgi:hypothetical protein
MHEQYQPGDRLNSGLCAGQDRFCAKSPLQSPRNAVTIWDVTIAVATLVSGLPVVPAEDQWVDALDLLERVPHSRCRAEGKAIGDAFHGHI